MNARLERLRMFLKKVFLSFFPVQEQPVVNIKVKFLKVKLKSLMAEARIIRHEEAKSKWNEDLREQLHIHRVREVRDEARATHLAYGFLRGAAHSSLERGEVRWDSYRLTLLWKRVEAMVTKYGAGQTLEDLKEWKGK